jgi:hypothetical protein
LADDPPLRSISMTAYEQGRAAYEQDMPKGENPYPRGSREYHYWKPGWDKGKIEDPKAQNIGEQTPEPKPTDKPPD